MPGTICAAGQPAQCRPAPVQQRGQAQVQQRVSAAPQALVTSRREWLAGLAAVTVAAAAPRPATATGLESIELPAGESCGRLRSHKECSKKFYDVLSGLKPESGGLHCSHCRALPAPLPNPALGCWPLPWHAHILPLPTPLCHGHDIDSKS